MHVFRLRGDFQTIDAYTPLLFDLGARGMEEKPGEVWAYFPERLELPLPGEWQELPDTDWLEAWKRDLRPVKAGPFVVMAPWHHWVGLEKPIVIEPGMAFGTGHHETTRMALEALARYVLPGMKVMDLGMGSGILAIAAAMLGAEADGVDNDETVVPLAAENARINEVTVAFWPGSLEDITGIYDVVVANLYAELHGRFAHRYPSILKPGAPLVMTGILLERETGVVEALKRAGFAPKERKQEGEWVLLVYTNKP